MSCFTQYVLNSFTLFFCFKCMILYRILNKERFKLGSITSTIYLECINVNVLKNY